MFYLKESNLTEVVAAVSKGTKIENSWTLTSPIYTITPTTTK